MSRLNLLRRANRQRLGGFSYPLLHRLMMGFEMTAEPRVQEVIYRGITTKADRAFYAAIESFRQRAEAERISIAEAASE